MVDDGGGLMAHQRLLKAEFFTDAEVAELPPLYRLFFQGLWCQADRNGTVQDNPKQLKARIMPYDDVDPVAAVDVLASRHFVIRYRVGEQRLLSIRSWKKNQPVHNSERHSALPDISKASEIVEVVTAQRELTVSAPVADGQLTPFPVPVPVPSPVPVMMSAPLANGEKPVREKASATVFAAIAFFVWAQEERRRAFPNAIEDHRRAGVEAWYEAALAVPGVTDERLRAGWLAWLTDSWGHSREPVCAFQAFMGDAVWRRCIPGQRTAPAAEASTPCTVPTCRRASDWVTWGGHRMCFEHGACWRNDFAPDGRPETQDEWEAFTQAFATAPMEASP